MDSAAQDDLKSLEQMRQRLQQLVNSLASLRRELEINDPLPSWPSIQNASALISLNLQSIAAHLDTRRDFFYSAHSFPYPSFPGRAQENLLRQLLNKKLEPGVEEWVEEGARTGSNIDESTGLLKNSSVKVVGASQTRSNDALQELWDWAASRAQAIASEVLVEGLKEDSSEGEEEDDDSGADVENERELGVQAEKMDLDDPKPKVSLPSTKAAKPMMLLEDLCRFINTGQEAERR